MSVTHAHQTAIADDPTKDVSATAWNEEHTVALVAADIATALAGTTAGGELAGTLDAPTVDASHSGSTHAATQAAAEATAAAALSGHEGAADPHTGYLKESVVSGFDTPAVVLGTAAAAGVATTAVRTDSTIVAFDATAPTTQAYGDAAATGSAAVAARRDHKHGFPAAGAPSDVDYLVGTATGALSAEIVVGTAPGGELGGTWASPTVDATHSGSTHAGAAAAAVTTHEGASDPHTGYLQESVVSGFATPAVVLGTAAAAGSATTAIRSDSTLLAFDATVPAAIGTAGAGAATVAARRDHVHPTGAGTPSTQAFGDAAATGTGPAAAMTDHKHAMPVNPLTAHESDTTPHPTMGAGDEAYFTNPAAVGPATVLGVRAGYYGPGAPDTVPIPPVRVSRIVELDPADMSGDGYEQASGLISLIEGTADHGAQVYGISATAYTVAETADDGFSPDGCGIKGIGWSDGIGVGLGAFLIGGRGVNSANGFGLEVQPWNATATPGSYNPTGPPTMAGIWIPANGTADSGVAIVVGNPFGNQFEVGLGFPGQVTGGKTGGVKDATIRDDGNATTVLDINGSHTDGIDMTGATFSGTALKLTQPGSFTPTNVTTDRSYDADATTLDEIADVLGTLLATLKVHGVTT